MRRFNAGNGERARCPFYGEAIGDLRFQRAADGANRTKRANEAEARGQRKNADSQSRPTRESTRARSAIWAGLAERWGIGNLRFQRAAADGANGTKRANRAEGKRGVCDEFGGDFGKGIRRHGRDACSTGGGAIATGRSFPREQGGRGAARP